MQRGKGEEQSKMKGWDAILFYLFLRFYLLIFRERGKEEEREEEKHDA